MQEVLWRICGAKNGLVSDFCGFLSFAELCLAKNKHLHKSLIKSHFRDKMAEGVGFEPTVGITPRSISSRVPSTGLSHPS